MAVQQTHRAGFFWQAFFILLPVAALSGFGFYSLRQDRLLAEQEARETGSVLAGRLAQAISTEGDKELAEFRNASLQLRNVRESTLGVLPGIDQPWTATNLLKSLLAWQQAHPEIDLNTLPPTDPDGYVEVQPETMPPAPPAWIQELSPQQQALWDAVKDSESKAGDIQAIQLAVDHLAASHPPPGAQASAEYLLCMAKIHRSSQSFDPGVFSKLLAAWPGQLTEAGLPVEQLAWLQRLRLMRDGTGLSSQDISSLTWAIARQASFISPRVIAEAKRVAAGTSSQDKTATLEAWWQARQKARLVLSGFNSQYQNDFQPGTLYWFRSEIGDYLIVLGDRRPTSVKDALPAIEFYEYLMIPKNVVEHALTAATARSGISFPAYARVEFKMAGKDIALAQTPAMETSPSTPVLGEVAGTWLKDHPIASKSCPFLVQVSLARPDLLYARQRQRTELFGLLILASAVAAMMGLFAAWRSFRRQQELNELKSNFVSSVSHELRAPIASVRLMAENLERGKVSEPAKQGEYFRFIVQECRRLSSLIENVLDFSRIEQGRKQYEFESANVVALMEATVKLMEPYATEKGVAIKNSTFNAQPSTPNIELNVDSHALQQALVNLIDNAIKHSPKGETVSVGLEPDTAARVVRLFVADHGPGIPAGEQEKIFERFYRLGSELRRETQGVGIGLSVVKHVVEAHGGLVRVESIVGQGSKFIIELPFNA